MPASPTWARPARSTLRLSGLYAALPARYLHHLFRAEEMLGPILLTWHNLTYYQDLMWRLRTAIIRQRKD